MILHIVAFLATAAAMSTAGHVPEDPVWMTESCAGFTLHYTAHDQGRVPEYRRLVETGVRDVGTFFDAPFRNEFDVFIHPDRLSMDTTWQQAWGMPGFRSECWMVASGVADRLDLLSPAIWTSAACEHDAADSLRTRQLITHELVHVFHGQRNASPDFSTVDGLDWFVEGLATYASGQCDSLRLAGVRQAVSDGTIPASLDDFWTGKLRYGLSGSVVMTIDRTYGREILEALLPLSRRSDVLDLLNTTEGGLLERWAAFVMSD